MYNAIITEGRNQRTFLYTRGGNMLADFRGDVHEMPADFHVVCVWLLPSHIFRFNLETSLFLEDLRHSINVTPAQEMNCPSCQGGSVLGCQRFLLSIYVRLLKKTRCPGMTQVSPSVIILNMPLLPFAFYFRIVRGTLESNSPGKLCVHTGLFLSEAAMLAGCFFTFYTH